MTAVKPAVVMSLAIIGIATGCVVSASRSASNDVPATLPSELVENPDKFDGKHVNVRGYVVITPEGRNIFDSKSGSKAREGVCLGLAGPNSMFTQFHQRYVKNLSGIFRKKICGPEDVCLYWCGDSGIELDSGSAP
jgi:hypothetical protein